MKKSILVLATAFFLFAGTTAVLTSCGSDENTETHEHMEDMDGMKDEAVYACPMHHNITGKKGDKCSICGMELTNTETAKEHQGHSH